MRRVFVNGTFDIIHCGHLSLLNYARSLGDYLLVALDSDARISTKKGPSRPVNSLESRLTLMSNLRAVDEVTSFTSDEQLCNIIEHYAPEVMVVGGDYKGKTVIGSEHAKELQFFDRISEHSTTAIIQRISESRL